MNTIALGCAQVMLLILTIQLGSIGANVRESKRKKGTKSMLRICLIATNKC